MKKQMYCYVEVVIREMTNAKIQNTEINFSCHFFGQAYQQCLKKWIKDKEETGYKYYLIDLEDVWEEWEGFKENGR